MALRRCPACGNPTADKNAICSGCGRKPRKSYLKVLLFAASLPIVFIVFLFIVAKQFPQTKEEREASRQASLDEDNRMHKTIDIASTLKERMREPDSLKWVFIYANNDASVICMQYRAKNGFGGINIENTVFSEGTLMQDDGVWQKQCTGGGLYNMKYVTDRI